MDDKRQKLKQAWTMIVMISCLLCLVVSAKAEVWRDDFNDKELIGWKPMGFIFTWKAENGFLHVKQDRPLQFQIPIGALQLIAFPGPHRKLTITATNMKTSTSFGIALGKEFPERGGAPFFYAFFMHRIYDRRFDGDGPSIPFQEWVPTHPGTIWEETREQLKEMKLTFNSGRFQIFANGKLRADFEDFHFDQIELICFVLTGSNQPGAEGWADSFEIFDSALGVEPKSKLTTSWGKMKRQPLF